MRISDSHAWRTDKVVKELQTPLPAHRVDDIEVFAASVHAVIHEHDWKVVSSQVSITDPFKIDVIFKCSSCTEMALKQAERYDFI